MVNLRSLLDEQSARKSIRTVTRISRRQTDSAPANSLVDPRSNCAAAPGDHRLATAVVVDHYSARHGFRHTAALCVVYPYLRCFCRVLFYFRTQPTQVASRETRTPTRLQDKDTAAGLFYRHKLSAHYRNGGVFLSVPQSLAREVVW